MARMAPENEAPGIITDHEYLFNPEWGAWGRCVRCGMAEAAHIASETPYEPPSDLRFRCPDCVTKGYSGCTHIPRKE